MYPGNLLHVHNFHKKSWKSNFTYYKRKQNFLNFDERLSRASVNNICSNKCVWEKKT